MGKITLNPVERVYYAFYISKKREMYFNEIRAKTGMSISSLQNVISKLDKSGETIRRKEKANTFYMLNDKRIIALHFTKFDMIKLDNLHRNIKIPVSEFLGKIGRVAFILLFGSASRGEEKKGSDIDVLVVTYKFEDGNLDGLYKKEIKRNFERAKKLADAKSLYPLSLAFVDEEEFTTRKDYLLEEGGKTGLCIYNNLNYYRMVFNYENL